MKIIMYHYIQEYNNSLPYFNFLSINNFKNQLDYFQNNYYFPTYDEFLSYINKEIQLPNNSIVLTFDDGLKCHYEYVLPELKIRKLWGIFYIPTGQYTNKKILNVHKVHLLLGKIAPNILYDNIITYINDNKNILIEDELPILYEMQNNNEIYKLVKKYLNYYIKPEYRSYIINLLFQKYFNNNEYDYVNKFYLTINEIKILEECGMIIGNHTVDHLVLAQLTYEKQLEQIQSSHFFLENIINKTIDSFCYPYGGEHVYNNDTHNILKQLKIKFAVDVYFSNTMSNIVNDNIYKIYRYDCNQFNFGSIYKYNFKHNDKFECESDITIKNNKKYDSITIFTGNQPRHISLVNKLKAICNTLYVIMECSTLFPKREGIMKEYFDKVKLSENKIFNKYKFIDDNINVLPICYNDASKLEINLLGKAIYSDVFIVYGSSWIRGDLCHFLEKKNTINIHLGISPYYRGTATTFWPIYDNNYEYVGGTIHSLINKLDAGRIYYTVLPKIINCDNAFDFTMMISEITQNVLVEKLKNYDIWRINAISQDNTKEIKNAKGSDFNTEVANDFLNNLPKIDHIKDIQKYMNYEKFINPIIIDINI